MPVHRTYANKNLTIFAIIGETTSEELMATLETFYAENPTLDILWDVRQGSVAKLSFNNVRTIAENVMKLSKKQHRRKTAIVTPEDVDYGIGRIFDAFAKIKEAPFAVRVFHNYDEAMAWLKANPNEE